MGGEKSPVLARSRLYESDYSTPLAADDAAITDYDKANPFIVIVQLDEQKGPWTAAYRLRWNKAGGGYSNLAATGECKYVSTTSLTDGNATAQKCTGDPGGTWQDGEQCEDGLVASAELPDEYYTEHHFGVSLEDADDNTLYGFDVYDETNGSQVDVLAVTVTTLAGSISISPTNSDHAHSADPAGATKQNISISPVASDHAHSADQPTFTIKRNISPSNSDHSHLSTQPAFTVRRNIGPNNSDHTHAATSPSFSIKWTLTPSDSSHLHNADQANASISAGINISPNHSNHAHSAGQPILNVKWDISPNQSDHAHVAEAAQTQIQNLEISPDSSSHFQAVQQAILNVTRSFIPGDSNHSHIADQPGFIVKYSILPNNSGHVQSSDSPSISIPIVINPDNCVHEHSVEASTINRIWEISPNNALHGGETVPNILIDIQTGQSYLRSGGVILKV